MEETMEVSMERLVRFCRPRLKILVLFHLFVVNAAADCQKPRATEKIVLSEATLLMNTFPDGSPVTLNCANGYQRESGSDTIVCTDGKWSIPALVCIEKDCGPLTPEPNMRFDVSQGTRFRARVKVSCDKGYQLSGTAYKRCYATGWIGMSTCQIITCAKPGNVTNGRTSWSSVDHPKYGEIIQYLCDDGYTLVGKELVTCIETGKYDSQPPECKGVSITVASTSPPAAIVTVTLAGASTDSSAATATATARRDKTITTDAATPISRSSPGGRHVMKRGGVGTTASASSTTSTEDLKIVDSNRDTGYIPVIFGLLGGLVAIVLIGLCIHKFLLRRKGSYDTKEEDMKPELLHFQNL